VTDRALTLSEECLEQAAAWHARLSGAAGDSDWLAFTAWLEADPAHRLAFDRVDAIVAEAVANKDSLSDDRRDARDNNVRLLPSRRNALVWSAGGAAVAALAASVALAILTQPRLDPASFTQAMSTQVGERRDVNLADGSSLHLNTNTALSVSLADGGRSVTLDKGEALFEVAADPARPFTVTIGDEKVRVLGTAFNVLRHDGKVQITVVHGVVTVGRAGSTETVRLTAGDHFLRQEGQSAFQLAKVDTAAVLNWREGQVVFEDQPLSSVVSTLNRYFTRPITIEDPAVQRLRFSGILKIDDEANVLRRLTAFLPVAVQERGETVVLKGAVE